MVVSDIIDLAKKAPKKIQKEAIDGLEYRYQPRGNVNRCQYVFTRGDYKNVKCGNKADETNYCKACKKKKGAK